MSQKPILNTDYFYRPVQFETDKSFILDAWMKGYVNNSPFKQIKGKAHFLYWKYQKLLILDLIRHGKTILICGENKTDLYGFVNYEIEEPFLILHWVYLKKDFRGFGLAKELIDNIQAQVISKPKEKIIVTHLATGIKLDARDFTYLPTWSFSFDEKEED